MQTSDRLHQAQVFFDRLAVKSDQWEKSSAEQLPLAHFLIAMSIVLQGVMVMDGTIHWTEEQLLHQILGEFWESDHLLKSQILQFLEDIQIKKLYLNPSIFEQLRETLWDEEKCLILALGFSLSAIDGHTEPREKLYLQNLSNRLNIPLETFSLIESAFNAPDTIDEERASQLKIALSPDILGQTAPTLRKIALYLLTAFGQS